MSQQLSEANLPEVSSTHPCLPTKRPWQVSFRYCPMTLPMPRLVMFTPISKDSTHPEPLKEAVSPVACSGLMRPFFNAKDMIPDHMNTSHCSRFILRRVLLPGRHTQALGLGSPSFCTPAKEVSSSSERTRATDRWACAHLPANHNSWSSVTLSLAKTGFSQ